MFRIALVGHSQIPRRFEVNQEDVTVDIYRAPGGKAANFFDDERLNKVLRQKYDLIILWIRSNDIEKDCVVREIAGNIKNIVKELEARCEAEVRTCLIRPRKTEDQPRVRIEPDTYIRVAKGINEALQKKLLKKNRFLSFGVKPFWDDLKRWCSFQPGRTRAHNN